MKELLTYIITSILPEGTEISVTETENEGYVTLTVTAPQEHIGKVIGKSGKTINSIKQIVKIIAIKENKRVEIEVKEQE